MRSRSRALRCASLVRAASVSSMRSRNRPPRRRASSRLNSAVRTLPRCSSPLGLGAKRVTTAAAFIFTMLMDVAAPWDEFIVTTLFVSDLHLDAAFPAAVAQFASFLKEEARAAQALYILGDLFETWVGDDDDDAQRAGVCPALRALSDAGVACHVCHGNRDFLLGTGFEQRTGTRLLADPTIIDLYGERVLLTHGDPLCTADPSYQRLRSVVRSPSWQRRFLRLPLSPPRRTGVKSQLGVILADQLRLYA